MNRAWEELHLICTYRPVHQLRNMRCNERHVATFPTSRLFSARHSLPPLLSGGLTLSCFHITLCAYTLPPPPPLPHPRGMRQEREHSVRSFKPPSLCLPDCAAFGPFLTGSISAAKEKRKSCTRSRNGCSSKIRLMNNQCPLPLASLHFSASPSLRVPRCRPAAPITLHYSLGHPLPLVMDKGTARGAAGGRAASAAPQEQRGSSLCGWVGVCGWEGWGRGRQTAGGKDDVRTGDDKRMKTAPSPVAL